MATSQTAPNASGLSPAAAVAAALQDGKKHLLLAASGSVATIKVPLIAAAFARVPNLSIRILLTPNAARFLAGQSAEQPTVASLRAIPNVDGVHCGDDDEWHPAWTRGAPILHIELRRWADLLVVAPMSANLLAKVTAGLCDSLLTCVIRAWETVPLAVAADSEDTFCPKRILVAPSMNTAMWNHPLTARQLATLRDTWGVPAGGGGGGSPGGWYEVLLPTSKALACGDVGVGAMADWKDIVRVIRDRLALSPDYEYSAESLA